MTRDSRWWVAAAAVLIAGVAGVVGCGPKQMVSNDSTRVQIYDQIRENPTWSTEMVDRLLASDTTRAIVVERVMTNGEARQELLLQAARDRTMVEGMLNVAVQDSLMRDHVLTLLRGMQMVGIR